MTREELKNVMMQMFQECMELREAGQKEYAHDVNEAFSNFNKLAEELCLDRKQILWVYAKKHIDGIVSYINGHKSQREDVRGRINDLVVYMNILRGMIEEEESRLALNKQILMQQQQLQNIAQSGARPLNLGQ